MGGYARGQDAELDAAIEMWPRLVNHIMQGEYEKADFETSMAALQSLTGS